MGTRTVEGAEFVVEDGIFAVDTLIVEGAEFVVVVENGICAVDSLIVEGAEVVVMVGVDIVDLNVGCAELIN